MFLANHGVFQTVPYFLTEFFSQILILWRLDFSRRFKH